MNFLDLDQLAEMPEFKEVAPETLGRLAQLANDSIAAANRQQQVFKEAVAASIPYIRQADAEKSDVLLTKLIFAGIDGIGHKFQQVKNDATGVFQWRDKDGALPYIEGGKEPTTAELANLEFAEILGLGNGSQNSDNQHHKPASKPGGALDLTAAKSRLEFNEMVEKHLQGQGITPKTRGYNDHAQTFIKDHKTFYQSLPQVAT